MEAENRIRSISEQILDELFVQLGQVSEIPPTLIEDLRRLAENGKLVDSEEIVRVITSSKGDVQ